MHPPYRPTGIHTANMPFAEQEFGVSRSPLVFPFVTIAQQAGAECPSLPQRLTETLNQQFEPAMSKRWSHWDQELVDKVSADSQIPAELIASLGTSWHSWVDDIMCGISGRPDEMIVFHRLKETVRGLAGGGHAILVGHGSTYLTHDLAGGIHVRLIAPMKFRTDSVAARLNLSSREAARYLRRLDRGRRTFFARFWPDRPLAPEMFTAVLNVAELDEERLIRMIVAMLPR